MVRQGFEEGDTIDLRAGDCGNDRGQAVWTRYEFVPDADPRAPGSRDLGVSLEGFLGPCGGFFTAKRLGHIIQERHEEAAAYGLDHVDLEHDFLGMAEQLIAEGLLKPGPSRGAKVWRED